MLQANAVLEFADWGPVGWPYFQLRSQNYTITLNWTATDLIAINIQLQLGATGNKILNGEPWPPLAPLVTGWENSINEVRVLEPGNMTKQSQLALAYNHCVERMAKKAVLCISEL